MSRLLPTMFSALLAAVLVAQAGCAGQVQAQRDVAAEEAAGNPALQEQVAARPPDVGPRIDALKGWHELAGVRVRIKDVYVSRGYDDEVVRWGNVPNEMWMKVDLEYEYLTKVSDATYYWWNQATADRSAIYDDSNRRSEGVSGFHYNQKETQEWIRQGLFRPTEETIFFAAPQRGSRYYDLDYAPDHLPPGEKYQFRILGVMIDWRE